MHNRIEWAKHAPEAYKAMVGLEQALAKSGLESSLLELVRLRASQITAAPTASTFTPTMRARPVRPKHACRP